MIEKLLKLEKFDSDSLAMLETVESLLNKEFRKVNERSEQVSEEIS